MKLLEKFIKIYLNILVIKKLVNYVIAMKNFHIL